MRALFLSAALISAALSGCVRCCVPLNAPPYDPSQWGWGPQERFYVTRSYYGLAKDYPGVHRIAWFRLGHLLIRCRPARPAPPAVRPAPPVGRQACRFGPLKCRWPSRMSPSAPVRSPSSERRSKAGG